MNHSDLEIGEDYLVKIGNNTWLYRLKAIIDVTTGPVALRGNTYIVEDITSGKRRTIYGAYHFIKPCKGTKETNDV